MEKQRNHYENLKVTRDAPIEVIRAAYRSLCQKYHPDRNAGSETATQMMKLLNVAYETLTDLAKRQQYDAWIGPGDAAIDRIDNGQMPAPEAMPGSQGFRGWRLRQLKGGYWYLLAILCGWVAIDGIADQSSMASSHYVASPMIFETSLTSPSLLKLAEAEKSKPYPPVRDPKALRPHYHVNALTASANIAAIRHGAEAEKASAVATSYDMGRVLEDM